MGCGWEHGTYSGVFIRMVEILYEVQVRRCIGICLDMEKLKMNIC